MSALEGMRVLDLGTFIAGPYCATMLGEFGAEVIKVEPPGSGDTLRKFGTDTACGDTLVWLSEGRNKKSVTLNLKSPRGLDLLKQLIAISDVIVENFRPGVMEKWGLDYEGIRAINRRAVLVRVSGFGQTGPYSKRAGFARVAHAFSGLAALAGEPGRVPVVPGSTSLADYLTGTYAAFGAMVALHARERTGEGQYVDLALYEGAFRVLDEMVPAFQQSGFVQGRMGADTVNVCPHSHYLTRDEKWVAIACSSDPMFERLAQAMERPALAAQDSYGPKNQRLAAREEINRIVAGWVASLDAESVLARCEAVGVPASLLYTVSDIFADPHYQARENIQHVASRIGEVAVPGVVPKLSATPGEIRWLGEALGGHNEEVLCGLLGVGNDEFATLRAQGVV